MKHLKVSIIILNWNGLKDTLECLESLRKIDYPNYEIVVVDNGSEGNDVEVLKERFGDYIYLIENDKNLGFSGGNNSGIRDALSRGTDYVLLLNNDTVVAPDFLTELIEVMLSDKKIGVAGPKMYYYHEPNKIWELGGFINYWTGTISPRGMGQMDDGQFEDVIDVDYASGSCILICRDLLSTVGLLDDRFFFGREDFDFCIRARKSGFRAVFVPKAKVWHKIAMSYTCGGRRSAAAIYHGVRGYFMLLEKHWSKFQFLTSVTYYFIVFLPKNFLLYLRYDRQWSTLKPFMQGFWDYLRRSPVTKSR